MLRRPTDLAGMERALGPFVTEESAARGMAFTPRPSDVFIAPYSKCGTTWMQQIVHGLRTGGSMDFEEITDVTPWIELCHDLGIDPDAPQVAEPRVFKSHMNWTRIPQGGRYITVFRDPMDACVSLYRFFDGWFFESGSISLEDFSLNFFLKRPLERSYWGHLTSWWSARERSDVLITCFEDMKQDLPGTVRRVAAFLDIPLDSALFDIVVQQASFDFMKRHDRQFDEHVNRVLRDPVCGLPPGGIATKVSDGKSGSAKPVLSQQVQDGFAARWQTDVAAPFGIPDYAAMRAAVSKYALVP